MALAFANDVFGHCLYAYHQGNREAVVTVHAPEFEDDEIPAAYLMRNQLPEWENKALDACGSKVLDVGACSGAHSKMLLKRGHEVTALDFDPEACRFMREVQHLPQVEHADFWDFQPTEKYDTVLLLMNGMGLAGKLHRVGDFLQHAVSMVKPNGSVIVESSDLSYLFDDIDPNATPYYGEMEYRVSFDTHMSDSFPWLYLAPAQLADICQALNLKLQYLYRGEDHNYVARIQRT